MWVYIGWSKYPRLKSTVFTGCLLTSYSQIPNQFPNKLIKFHTSHPQKKILNNEIQTNSELFSANLLFYLSIIIRVHGPNQTTHEKPCITVLIGLPYFTWVIPLTNFRLNNSMTKVLKSVISETIYNQHCQKVWV